MTDLKEFRERMIEELDDLTKKLDILINLVKDEGEELLIEELEEARKKAVELREKYETYPEERLPELFNGVISLGETIASVADKFPELILKFDRKEKRKVAN